MFLSFQLQTTFEAETQTETVKAKNAARRFIDLCFCIQHKALLMEQEQLVTWEEGLEEEEEELTPNTDETQKKTVGGVPGPPGVSHQYNLRDY